MFELKPDFETVLKRMDAYWERELIDRPLISFTLPKPAHEQKRLPPSNHSTAGARWLDAEYQAEYALAFLSNQQFMGDALPVGNVNLGPDVLASLYGCPLHFGDYGTSWSTPILKDWTEADLVSMDLDNFYMRKLVELTDAFLEIGQGKFITGMPDWHPGGDLLAALRGSQNLATDLLDAKHEVKSLLARFEPDYFRVYDIFVEKLLKAGQPITAWIALAGYKKFYIPSNDFSIMISNRMYQEFFLPGIIRECQFLDRSIYHLDGPGALRHLDSILGIKELGALQFQPGAGNTEYSKWIPVYQKAQRANKGILVYCKVEEFPLVMETLSPKGVLIELEGVTDVETGDAILRAAEKWAVSNG